MLTHGDDRRPFAAADARRGDHANVVANRRAKLLEQLPGSKQRTAQAVADPYREGGRWRFVSRHDIEVVVKGGDLEDFGQSQAHLVRQRNEMAVRQVAIAILDQVEMARSAGRADAAARRATLALPRAPRPRFGGPFRKICRPGPSWACRIA